MEDLTDDGFEELEREYSGSNVPPATIKCALMGRSKARRLSITLRLPKLDPDIRTIADRTRFQVAYNESARTLRIKASDRGSFEAVTPAKGPDARIFRVPFPKSGVEWSPEKFPVEVDYNLEQMSLLIELPRELWPKPKPRALLEPPRTPASVGSTTKLQITGPYVKQAPTAEEIEEVDKRVKEMLGVTPDFPREFGTIRFTPQETSIIEVLYKKGECTREGLLAASHDPRKGEDDREGNVIAVLVSKINSKLKGTGCQIENLWGTGYSMSAKSKTWIKSWLDTMDQEVA